jgi:predicted RNA-binding Zn-ribbon protein involved in translation (DUF1610 family)
MTGRRRTPGTGVTRQALDADGAASVMSKQAQEDVLPDADAQALVCRSARLTPAAYQFYRAILLAFVAHSGAPEPDEVADLAQTFGVPLESTLARMEEQDLLQRDPATGRIRAAYPFSGVPTSHRVTLLTDQSGVRTDQCETQVYAMCALDALGIPLMLRRAALINSADAYTGEAIGVLAHPPVEALDPPATISAADWSVSWDPVSAVVSARPAEHEAEHDAGICQAEGTCCPVTNFFATPNTAQAWLSQRSSLEPKRAVDGLVLDQRAALARAQALFADVLDRLPQQPADAPAAVASDLILDDRVEPVKTAATITCPHCGDQQLVEMPQNACQIRYICPRCGVVLRPLAGDCCVFCSYADQRCPPEQLARQSDLH